MEQWRIQDFPEGGTNSQSSIFLPFFLPAENCMKMNEFGARGGYHLLRPLGSANVDDYTIWALLFRLNTYYCIWNSVLVGPLLEVVHSENTMGRLNA